MTQLPPELGPAFEDRDLLARATGLAVDDLRDDVPALRASTGLPALLVPVSTPETLRRARIDQRLVAVACERSSSDELYLFALGPGDDVTARFFGPTIGIFEDPATGSAAGPLGAYLAEYGLAGMPGSLIVHQGEQVGRPSELHVEVAAEGDSWRVRVGGGVHVIGEGTFRL
jgi:trans-2,3-dihydro-3-hydroxyanthranilate isomerase